MPICPICDDTGLMNSDATNPSFCYCAAGKLARQQWEAGSSKKAGKAGTHPAGFIDISQLDQVNADVDAMRASLLGSATKEAASPTKHPAVQMLYRIAHAGHEVSMIEAAQLHDLAKTLESFFDNMGMIGRKR